MWFVAVKIVGAAVLGVLGFRNLQMVKAQFPDDSAVLFRRTLIIESGLMLVVIALAVTLARMANP